LFFQEQKQLIKKIENPFDAGENRLKKTQSFLSFLVQRLSDLHADANGKWLFYPLFFVSERNFQQTCN